ncbi:extracellular solute-binding protein [Rhizobiaceae bacterium BDR2-2]|uniref:Extracellular solute-binding protein n=1 Tax=Ectorhizobium quercum TaxID=2965071 RepID=A0AAE3N287_9HYPH|nr:extracellular solute-binding protein [Ectorhizobium quercum]MCX8997950.1 extracellular solute-binding protein [Ectorhizobium quercum]
MISLSKFKRRDFIKGVGAGVGLAVAMGVRPGFAAGGRVVVGTWGGDYARLLNKNIEQPFLIPQGWEVVQDQAGDPERRAKLAAERRLPRGSVDVHGLNGSNMYQVFQLGLTQEIDYSRIPNAEHLLPSMRDGYGVPHIYSGKVVLFNPELIPSAPSSYAGILSPELGNKLGIIDIQYQYVMLAAALAAGGNLTAMDDGKKLLLEIRKAGGRIYPTNEAFAQGLQTGEIGGGIMWKARAVQWQNAGIKVEAVTPSEGILPYTSGMVIPKNAPNVEGAYAYINASLEPAAQQAFAVDMGYDGTVENAGIDADLKSRIGFTPEEVAKIQTIDQEFILNNDVEMKDWWDKEFKA